MAAANPAVSRAELEELVKATVRRSPGLLVQDRITAAAKLLRLPRARVKGWYYGEIQRADDWEGQTIREFALRARESEIRRMERQLEALRAELAQMAPLDGIRPAAVPRLRHKRQPRGGRAQTA